MANGMEEPTPVATAWPSKSDGSDIIQLEKIAELAPNQVITANRIPPATSNPRMNMNSFPIAVRLAQMAFLRA
jgi:hypothetical protein